MFKRPHHQRVLQILHALDSDLLARANCYFGGGTAIVLALGEYRESVDIDFLCADRDGYRLLRNAITPPTLGAILTTPIQRRRDVRTDRDKISTYLEIDNAPVKVEFVLEGRIGLDGTMDPNLRVPVLSRDDMYAEKLLANTDRGLDRATMSRDLIDLAMMIRAWGPIPEAAWLKGEQAYGSAVHDYFGRCVSMLGDREYLTRCLQTMDMKAELANDIIEAINSERRA